MTYRTESDEETKGVAKEVIEQCSTRETTGATVLALYGELGAGKTTFTQGVAEALGVEDRVTSPTFVIESRYETPHPRFHTLLHIDTYRLESGGELIALGWKEKLKDPGTLVCLEWPEHVSDCVPTDVVSVRFTPGEGDVREIEVTI